MPGATDATATPLVRNHSPGPRCSGRRPAGTPRGLEGPARRRIEDALNTSLASHYLSRYRKVTVLQPSGRRNGRRPGTASVSCTPSTPTASTARKRREPPDRAGPHPAERVTVGDSKRFARQLALPRSCPPYVRDPWTDRTHDRIRGSRRRRSERIADADPGWTFSQVSTE